MKLRYLETSEAGLRWMRRYYREHPQLDLHKAVASLRRAEAVLSENAYAGSTYEDHTRVRIYPLHGTAFSLIYTVSQQTIWVIDVHDQRGFRSAEALRGFMAELRTQVQRSSK